MIKLSIIIPYYQKQPGILRRALFSVMEQEISEQVQVEVIVVDDGSPVPAKGEVEGLNFAEPHRLTVLEQPDAGVGAARNAGLRHVGVDVDYIAFLDSDDIWKPQHLTRAIETLEQGYDYYFCDARRVGVEASFFQERKFEEFLATAGAETLGNNTYTLNKDKFFRFCLRKRPSMIPAIVYRRAAAPDHLFDTSLKMAGEDCLFLFQLISRCRNVCCSLDELVICAEGINIYAKTSSWDSPASLSRYMCSLLALYQFRDRLRLTPNDENFFRRRIKKVRQIFAFLTLRHFLKYRASWSQELRNMVHRDYRFWRWYPLYVLYVAVCFPLRLYNPMEDFWCAEGEAI